MATKKRTTTKSHRNETGRINTAVLDSLTSFEAQSVSDLFSSEENEDYLPFALEQMASDYSEKTGFNITPEQMVIAAVHLLLFGDDKAHLDEFLANPTSLKFRSETDEEELFVRTVNATISYLDPEPHTNGWSPEFRLDLGKLFGGDVIEGQ